MNPASFFRQLCGLSGRELFLIAEAVFALTVAYAAIKILPFRTVVRGIGVRKPSFKRSEMEMLVVGIEVQRAIKRAARRLPWMIVCFPAGLAAHWMLRRRGAPSQVHYGVRTSQAGLTAHVWVTLAGETIVGDERDHPHACVAVFPLDASA